MLTIIRFAIGNLFRRRLRTVVTTTGVAIAVACLFSLFSFEKGYQNGLRVELDRLGAQILVVPKGCPYDATSMALHGASWPCYLKSSYLQSVQSTPHVTVAAPVLMNAVYEDNTGAQDVYCGVQPNILQVKKAWSIKGAYPVNKNDLLVGSENARLHNWHIGQVVSLPGLQNETGRISGILAPTQSADDLFTYVSLADSQRIFNRPGQLTHILLRIDAPENMATVVSGLQACDAGLDMNVVPMSHLFDTMESLIESTRLLLLCVVFVALIAAGAGVTNTVLMSVLERTREIGVLRAIGGSRSDIFGMIFIETAALCVVGGVIGVIAAISGAGAVESWLRNQLPFSPTEAFMRPEFSAVMSCIIGSAVLGAFATIVPSWRASRMSPCEAIRTAGGV